jgi:hypothetical protein
MGIVPRDSDGPSSPPDHILGRNGEETAKTRKQRAQTALEIPIPRQEPTKRIPTIFNPKYVVHPDSRFSKIGEINQGQLVSLANSVYSRGSRLVARGRFDLEVEYISTLHCKV